MHHSISTVKEEIEKIADNNEVKLHGHPNKNCHHKAQKFNFCQEFDELDHSNAGYPVPQIISKISITRPRIAEASIMDKLNVNSVLVLSKSLTFECEPSNYYFILFNYIILFHVKYIKGNLYAD